MNRTVISGRLGKDPELKKTPNNHSVISTQLAVDGYKAKDGTEQEPSWIDIVIWNKQADFIGQNANKGDTLVVEGRLDKRSWEDNDGVKRYVTEVIAERVELFKKQENNNKTYDYTGERVANQTVKKEEIQAEDLSEMELPF